MNSLAAQNGDTTDETGLVTDVLVDFGFPAELAGVIGPAVVFVAVLVTFYVASRLLVVPLVDYDTHGTLRLRFTFRISFEDDIDRATDIILGAAGDTDGVLDEPEPDVKLLEINESSFGLQGRIWIADPGGSNFLGIRGQFVQAVTERFDREDVTIPYPRRTVEGTLDRPGDGRPEWLSDN